MKGILQTVTERRARRKLVECELVECDGSFHPDYAPTLHKIEDGCRKQAWVLKKSVIGTSFWLRLSLLPSFFFALQLSGSFHGWGRRLTEEPHQSLEVLGRRCEEELLTNELHPA